MKKKMWPAEFNDVIAGKKKIDIRVADFDVSEGDTIIFEEWDPQLKEGTGRTIEKKVASIVKFGIDDYGQREQVEMNGIYAIGLE